MFGHSVVRLNEREFANAQIISHVITDKRGVAEHLGYGPRCAEGLPSRLEGPHDVAFDPESH